jgi:hypothetical protein
VEAPGAGAEEKEDPQIREGLKRLWEIPFFVARRDGVSDFEGFGGIAKATP